MKRMPKALSRQSIDVRGLICIHALTDRNQSTVAFWNDSLFQWLYNTLWNITTR